MQILCDSFMVTDWPIDFLWCGRFPIYCTRFSEHTWGFKKSVKKSQTRCLLEICYTRYFCLFCCKYFPIKFKENLQVQNLLRIETTQYNTKNNYFFLVFEKNFRMPWILLISSGCLTGTIILFELVKKLHCY